MAFPQLNLVSTIREIAVEAKAKEGGVVTIREPEMITALIQMSDELLRIGSPAVDPYRLDKLTGIGAASMRALRARGITNLKALARAKPDAIRQFLAVEGVAPKKEVDEWPERASTLVKEITDSLKGKGA